MIDAGADPGLSKGERGERQESGGGPAELPIVVQGVQLFSFSAFMHIHRKPGPKVNDLSDSSPVSEAAHTFGQGGRGGGRQVRPCLDPPLYS